MKTIAFDIGTVRVGVAGSDPLGTVATPLQVISRGDDPDEDARRLVELARLHGAEKIVVGMPISLRGRRELAAEHVQAFVDLLVEHSDVPVVLWDERMTTVIAERALLQANMSREGRREKIDQVAAAVILQSYLDFQANTRGNGEPQPQ